MSKFLKVIDALLLALVIVSGAALIIPQMLNIETIVVQQEYTGNQPVGTVIYARKQSSDQMKTGQRILDWQATSTTIYKVKSYDAAANLVQVTGGPETSFNVSSSYYRVLLSVPMIGYLLLATRTTKGLILLGVLLAVIIFVFIVSELIRDKDEDDDIEEADGEGDYSDLVEKKRRRDAEEEARHTRRRRAAEDEEDEAPRARRRVRFADEDDEDDDFPEATPVRAAADTKPPRRTPAAEGAAGGTTGGQDVLPDVQAALEAALENQPMNRTSQLPPVRPVEADDAPNIAANGEIELAMPVHSADELLSKAYADGLDPKVKDDDTTGITLVDYSDCL